MVGFVMVTGMTMLALIKAYEGFGEGDWHDEDGS